MPNSIQSMSFFITKATESDGVRRWTATPTKFAADKEKDEVTREFYEYAATMIEAGAHPTPALVVSHFDDPRFSKAHEPTPAEFAAGWTTELFIDGKQPKARGIFEDNELGDAVYEAVKADMDDDVPHDERIRISMAWRPVKGGLEEVEGITRHTKGMVRHFAATRVPIIADTDILVEKAGVRKTKFQDASTIIGEDLAAELDDFHNSIAFDEKADLVVKAEEKAGTYHDGSAFEFYYEHVDKADDEKKDNGKKKQPVSRMAKCVNKAMDGGAERRDAVASCLKKMPASEKKTSEKLGTVDAEKAHHVTTGYRRNDKGYQACLDRLKRQGFFHTTAVAHCRRPPLGGDYLPPRPQEKLGTCMSRVMRLGGTASQARQYCGQAILERADLLSQSQRDDLVLLDMALYYGNLEVDESDIVEKPALDAPMGACVRSYMDEGKKHDQAVAICMDAKRRMARKDSGTEKGELHALLDAIISGDDFQVVSENGGTPVTKSEMSGTHPSTHFLVVLDPRNSSTWHLPVRNEQGELAVDLMDAAWKALVHPDGIYKGPRREEAIYKLEDLYAAVGLQPPTNKAHLDEMPLEDILAGELQKAESFADELMGELIEMTKQEAERSDTEVEEEAKDEEEEAREAEGAEEAAAAEEAASEESPAEEPAAEETPAAEEEAVEEEAEEDEEKEKESEGESEPAQAEDAPSTDVNAGDVASGEAVKSEAESEGELDGLVNQLKSALSDPTLDRGAKVQFANAVFEKMGEAVNEAVQETPPSADDEAEKFKAEMMGIVTPLADQIAELQAENAEMKAQLDGRDVVFQPPTPQQLEYQGVDKGDVDDAGGAMTAEQIAKGTVNYDRPPY